MRYDDMRLPPPHGGHHGGHHGHGPPPHNAAPYGGHGDYRDHGGHDNYGGPQHHGGGSYGGYHPQDDHAGGAAELEIFVANSIVARVIGVGGNVVWISSRHNMGCDSVLQVKEIERTSGAKVLIDKTPNHNGDRKVKLSGTVQACRTAEVTPPTNILQLNAFRERSHD